MCPCCSLQRFWAGDLDEYRYIPAHEIADAFYATPPGAAIMQELATPVSAETISHAELATHK